MATYFGIPSRPDGLLELRDFQEADRSSGILQRSLLLSSYSPQADRDIKDLPWVQCPLEPGNYRGQKRAFVGGRAVDGLLFLEQRDLRVVALGSSLTQAIEFGERLGSGRVVAIGATQYASQERDLIRSTQRLLPPHEVPLEWALKTAWEETAEHSVLLSLNMDVFSINDVPEITRASFLGESVKYFLEVLKQLDAKRLSGFHLWGFPDQIDAGSRTSVAGAEILRDALLFLGSAY